MLNYFILHNFKTTVDTHEQNRLLWDSSHASIRIQRSRNSVEAVNIKILISFASQKYDIAKAHVIEGNLFGCGCINSHYCRIGTLNI